MLVEASGKTNPGIGVHGTPFFGSSNPKQEDQKNSAVPYSNYWDKPSKNEECTNSFDSLKLQLPLPKVAVDLSKFYPCNQYGTVYRLQDQHRPVGLASAEVNTKLKTFTISLSSKTLRANCMKLLTAATLPVVHQALTASQAFSCDYSDFLEAKVLRVDLTANLWCVRSSELIQALQAYSSAQYRVSDPYRTKAGQFSSIEFHRQVKATRNKLRVIIYDKTQEILKDQTFTALLTNEEQRHLLSQVHNQIRIEVNLKSFKSIRNYLDIEDNTLKKVIYSNNKAIHSIMQTITAKGPATINGNAVDLTQLTPRELTYFLALQAKDFNLDVIRAMYKAIDTKNTSRLMQPYQDLVSKYSSSQSQPLVTALLESLSE